MQKAELLLKAAGHDIKAPQPEGGPRKKSFCARMKGMKESLLLLKQLEILIVELISH